MKRIIGRFRRRAASEAGFTLTELLMAIAVSMVVLGGGVAVMTAGARSGPELADRSTDIQTARVAMEQITRELRQGSSVMSAAADQLSLVTLVNSSTCGGAPTTQARTCIVSYACEAGSCTRTETEPDGGGGGSPEPVIKGLVSDAVFSYTPSAAAPTAVGVSLELEAATGSESITLSDSVTLRNAGAPGS